MMLMKKILIVIDTLGSGGAQRLKIELALGLQKEGYNVDICAYNNENPFFVDAITKSKINLYQLKKNTKGFSVGVISQLRKIIAEGHYDYIISSLHAPSIYSFFANIGSKTKQIICEESSSLAPVSPLRRLLFNIVKIFCFKIVVNSHNEKEIMSKFLIKKKKIHVIWNGFNLDQFDLNSEISFNQKFSNGIIVGRVAYPKNGLNFLKGLNLFLTKNSWAPEIKWVGRFDNDHRSIEMQKMMKAYLQKNPQLNNKIKFIGEVKDITKYFKEADALIHPSIYEGLPMTICESMFLGCFVICSNVCDHPRVIKNEKRGLLFNPHSPESICEALERFSKLCVSDKKTISNEARKFAIKNFNMREMVTRYEKLF